jgi:hypothetical protein
MRESSSAAVFPASSESLRLLALKRGGRIYQSRRDWQLPFAGLLRSYLGGQQRLEAQLARFRFKSGRSEGLLLLQHQVLLFREQLVAFATKSFALVAILNGCELLLCGKNETTGQNHSAANQ